MILMSWKGSESDVVKMMKYDYDQKQTRSMNVVITRWWCQCRLSTASNNEMELILLMKIQFAVAGIATHKRAISNARNKLNQCFQSSSLLSHNCASDFHPAAMPSTIIIYDFTMRHEREIKISSSNTRTEMNVFIIIFFAFGSNAKTSWKKKDRTRIDSILLKRMENSRNEKWSSKTIFFLSSSKLLWILRNWDWELIPHRLILLDETVEADGIDAILGPKQNDKLKTSQDENKMFCEEEGITKIAMKRNHNKNLFVCIPSASSLS